MVRSFIRQLGWELAKLWRRPRTYLGLAGCLFCEVVLVALYHATPLDEAIGKTFWRVPPEIAAGALSGLTSGMHIVAQTMALMASLFLALVAGDIIANESEERTLHMVFSRPVSREAVLGQKILTCAVYTAVLALFVGASTLGLALLVSGPGPLVMVSARESIVGVLPFETGLRRCLLAIVLLVPCWLTFTLLAFTLSCWHVKPGVATVGALAILVAHELQRLQPGIPAYTQYALTTRLLTWRQVFSDEIPWLRIERNLSQLALLDVALILLAWWTFRRRELAP
jgi:ABC-2 type transport system permease protein